MKEFIEKLIVRLREKFKYNSEQAEIYRSRSDNDAYFREKEDLYRDRANTYGEVMRIVNRLAEEYKTDKVNQLAMMYAQNMYMFGVDVTKAWETATSQSASLNEVYLRGRQDERDKFAKWQDKHKDNVMINGQYCWQTCGATEHCKECNRLCNGSIDYYENYDVLAEKYNNDFCEWKSEKDIFIQNPHTGRRFSNEPSMRNVYCNTCGKKIRVAPYQTKGE